MATLRRALMLLLCVMVAALAGAASHDKEKKQEKKERATEKKAARSESSHRQKDAANGAKQERADDSRWQKDRRYEKRQYQKDAIHEEKWRLASDRWWDRRERRIREKEFYAARHGYHYFSHDHFIAYHDYYVGLYGYECPPGLVPGYGGCFWPGYSRRRYVIGEVLPYGVPFEPAPLALIKVVGPPPPGYMYVMVDGDLVELLVGTRMVVDALEGFVEGE